MSAVTKKPTGGTTPGRRPAPDSSSISPRASPTPTTTSTPNGITRTRSIRTNPRASLQRPGAGTSNLSSNSITSDADENARAETVAVIDDLKEQLRKSEDSANQYSKQAQVLQSRLDDTLQEHGKLEDKIHEYEEKLEALEIEKRDSLRQRREMESIYEAERSSMNKEREDMSNREEEMQAVIQRLKDSLNSRSDEDIRIPRRSNNNSPSLESQFAPTSGLNRSDSRNNSKLILQKDRLIESLRLELAEAQIKMVESENMGGGRLQEIERKLLEARMANARLMEDNESYQLLLQERTLTGDFKSEFLGTASNEDALNALEGRARAPSLADELSGLGDGESEGESQKRLDSELKAAKAENKALTLYINKIIERLLQHQDFEAILDQSSDFKPSANTDKDLPPPPPAKEASGTSILQRAKSVALGGGRRPRPQSVMPAPYSAITDKDTAPSIPIGLTRSNTMRTRPASEQFSAGPANIVSQMYKGPGQMSPPLHSPQTPRNSQSFFATQNGTQNPNAAQRIPSGNSVIAGNFPGMGSMRSETSSESGDVTTPGNTPPRQREPEKATTFAGNKPRPLRLVQDKVKEEEAVNKRSSWMGWAFGGAKKDDDGREEGIKEER